MKRMLLSTAAFLALMGYSEAADLEAAPSVWEGPYAGLNAGYAAIPTELEFSLGDETAHPLTLGLQAGYNAQWDNLVLGVEGDFNGLFGDEIDMIYAGGKDTYIADYEWFGTLRARAGYAADATLLYITAGAAFLGMDTHVVGLDISDTETLKGWTVGAGAEMKFSDSLSGKLEYLYADFGTEQPIEADHDASMHVIRAGLNYHF